MDARVREALDDLLEFAATGARIVELGRARFDDDELVQLAAEAVFIRIGAAVARLGDPFTAAHPAVRWRQMKDLRNLVAHEYAVIDDDVLWRTLEVDLPQEAAAIRTIRDDED
ncbi:Uncharacterized conserved protein, contains HEPN domain [Agrococcus baldri]|uniref:Uncharacterized conserved protein, contains HEPN domain n=1 Tax=Agrococcus baldri TaxID=153730 RepID=A0AA94HKK2_9MICO|nr:HepT-like ribonuclease domain-containing protein [Agrococcus baldri]SFS01025.1 Uncharacterized conserved protein, contains HEPN domain [Agrococcus baldri]